MLQAELIDGLEALTGWTPTVKAFVGLARKGVELPYATVLEQSLPQFGTTAGRHPVYTHSGFLLTVYAETQLRAKELATLAYDHLIDFTGKLVVTGSRVIDASEIGESPQDGVLAPDGEPPIFLTSFTVHFIHKAG